jgi:hypothetical protein
MKKLLLAVIVILASVIVSLGIADILGISVGYFGSYSILRSNVGRTSFVIGLCVLGCIWVWGNYRSSKVNESETNRSGWE